MEYTPKNVNQSVSDLMAKLYGSTDTMSKPGMATSVAPYQGAIQMATPSALQPNMSVYTPPTSNTVPQTNTQTPTSFQGGGSPSILNTRPIQSTGPIAPVQTDTNNTIGSYKGVPIMAGTDAEVAAQIARINGSQTEITGTPTDGTVTPPGDSPTSPTSPTYTHALSAQDIIDQGYINPTPMAEPDPNTIYQNQLRQVQSEIDSANSLYNDMLVASRARLAPIQKARTDQGFINNVRSGTIGSGFDTGVNEKITTANLDETQAAEAEINEKRAQALAGIRGQARKSAETELAYQREQKSKNADAIIDEIKTRPERKKTALSPVVLDMLSKGVDPSEMTPEALADLAKSFGKLNVSVSDITAAYKAAESSKKSAEREAEKDQASINKTNAETAKIEADVENWGKMTDYQKAQIAIDNYKAKNPSGTEKEKKANALGQIASELNQNSKLPDGSTPVMDTNGYITPEAYKYLVQNAPQLGLAKSDVLEQFGQLLYKDKKAGYSSYGLTGADIKIITGSLPE